MNKMNKLEKKEKREKKIINDLGLRFQDYRDNLKQITHYNEYRNRKSYSFGNKFVGYITFAIMIVINVFALLFFLKMKLTLTTILVVALICVAIHIVCILSAVTIFREAKIIEKTKANYAESFELTFDERIDRYYIKLTVNTPITGKYQYEAELISKEIYDYLQTQEKVPVYLEYGHGLRYTIDYSKIRKEMAKINYNRNEVNQNEN
jgi:hypothetical protein